MRVVHRARIPVAKVTCCHCTSRLEIDLSDVEIVKHSFGLSGQEQIVKESYKCPVCSKENIISTTTLFP